MVPSFVIEAVMLASYGQLALPGRPVHYMIPYVTILELYEMDQTEGAIMQDPSEDVHVRQKIRELIRFFEQDLTRKKIEQTLTVPWRKSSPIIVDEHITMTVIHTSDDARYGEVFDPIETELLQAAEREQLPILTDQFEFIERVIETGISVRLWDVEDFDYALESEGNLDGVL